MVVSIPESIKPSEEVMRTVTAVLLLFSMVPVLHACPVPETDKDRMERRQDGDDVVISTTVMSGGPGHMVLTSYAIDEKNQVTLKYTLIQSEENSQLDSLAYVKVEWRLKGVNLSQLSFKIQGQQLTFKQAELDQLRNQLNPQPRRDAELRSK